MKTKINYLFLLLLVNGCQTNKTEQKITELSAPPPPFVPSILLNKEIQINRLPHPFNLDGTMPYAVWVDGKRLPLNSKELKSLELALDLEFAQPENTAEIHSGEGWLFPRNLNKTPFPPKNNFVEKYLNE